MLTLGVHVFSMEYRGGNRNDRSLWGAQFGEKFGEVPHVESSFVNITYETQPLLETWSWTERINLVVEYDEVSTPDADAHFLNVNECIGLLFSLIEGSTTSVGRRKLPSRRSQSLK